MSVAFLGYFDAAQCEICAARTGTHVMVGTMFGDVWICEQCHWGEPDAKTPESLAKATPRAEALALVPTQQGHHAAASSEHAPHDARAELSDEFYDDCKSEDEEHYPEASPQTGFV